MPKFNTEDKRDHHSTAAVIRNKDWKYLIMRHVKHNMLTFCIGKCKPEGTPSQGLRTEALEELGIHISHAKEVTHYEKTYDFTGQSVKVDTHLFEVQVYDGNIYNKEPHKCGGLLWMTREELEAAYARGERVADCIMEYFKYLNQKGESK